MNDKLYTGGDIKVIRKVKTGGIRNEESLSQEQIEQAVNYAVSLGIPRDNIAYRDSYWTGYNYTSDILLLGTDLYPVSHTLNKKRQANSDVS